MNKQDSENKHIQTSCGIDAIVLQPLATDVQTCSNLIKYIEEDIVISELQNVSKILVTEQYKETNSFYENETNSGGVSFFHTVNNKDIHVRIS